MPRENGGAREGELGGALSLHDFLIEKELARTAAGSVYRAKHGRSGRTVVLKARRSAEIGRDGSIEHEVHLLQSLSHPNIIKCYGSFWNHPGGTFHMVLEFAEGGDLATLIANTKRRSETLHEEKIWQLWLPIMQVACYLHEKGIIHRDIKALNVFLKANKEVKVGDFGVGRVMSENTLMVDTMYGTPLYLSPELCQNEPYNAKTDIWSCGVLLYELCSLETPFPGRNLIELSKNICAGRMKPVPERYSKLMKRAISALLERDQKTRPSANRFLDWYKSAREYIREAESAGPGGQGANRGDERPSDGVRNKDGPSGPNYLAGDHGRNREHEQEMESDHDCAGERRREQGQRRSREERLERDRERRQEWDSERSRRRDGNGESRGSGATMMFPAQQKSESDRASLMPANASAQRCDSQLGKEQYANIRDPGARRETGKQERTAEQDRVSIRPQDQGRSRYGDVRGRREGSGEPGPVEHAVCRGRDRRGDERRLTDECDSPLLSSSDGRTAQRARTGLAGANREREKRSKERNARERDLITRVASDPGPPSPVVQNKHESRHIHDRDVASCNSVEWDPDDRNRNRVEGRMSGGIGAGVPALQWRGGAGAPWDDRPQSTKSDSVASSASQRDALLSARRQFHFQRRQEGRKEEVRFVDAAKDRGINARSGPQPLDSPSVASSRSDTCESTRSHKSATSASRKQDSSDWFEWRSNPADTRSSQASFLDKMGGGSDGSAGGAAGAKRAQYRPRASEHSTLFGQAVGGLMLPPRDPMRDANSICEHNRIRRHCRDCPSAAPASGGGKSHGFRPGSAPWLEWQE